jgi:DNA-binding SARP family transcriptional activator
MREYRAAEALYGGEFLEDDRYETWLIPVRHTLEERFLGILEWLSEYCLEQEDLAGSASLCRRMLEIDACNEKAHRSLMRCYERQGQRHLALRQYHLCAEALRQELDVTPTLATTELYERIHRQH